MKLLTLNTYSWMLEDSLSKLDQLAKAIHRENFDIIALQEVNQTISAPELPVEYLLNRGFIFKDKSPKIKKDNFALNLIEKLHSLGTNYYWSFAKNHIGYDKFDEGVSILSRHKITAVTDFFISKSTSYSDYKTRKTVGLKTLINGSEKWFFSIHMGWWDDDTDPFSNQWNIVQNKLKKYQSNEIYLMGDFNSPFEIRNQGYDLITKDKIWFDTHNLAINHDSGQTVIKKIDGWKNKTTPSAMRIDYIFKNSSDIIKSSNVIFNGDNYPIVSDHFGICIEE